MKCFYSKLRESQEYHRNFTPIGAKLEYKGPKVLLDRVFQPPRAPPAFTGEESDGKYVDMEALYQEFLNLKKIREVVEQPGGYIWYLQNFDHFHEIPLNLKQRLFRPYRRYLNNLVTYLTDFFKKTQPLADFEIVEKQFDNDFEHKWNEGTVRGWEGFGGADAVDGNGPNDSNGNLGNHDSEKDAALYCEACAKQFTNQNVYVKHFEGKKHRINQQNLDKAKANATSSSQKGQDQEVAEMLGGPSAPRKGLGGDSAEGQLEEVGDFAGEYNGPKFAEPFNLENKKKIAKLESYVMNMKNLLCDVVLDTMNYIRAKKTRTLVELIKRDEEKEEQPQIEEEETDDEEEVKYNPKNLPIGWDGKPIPYWVYKLHGLGIEYKCEICGNYSYWGRRAFERHFQEWRHAYGMKCLGIPNTVHFKEITLINDARVLHRKLLMETHTNTFNPELEAEYEDEQGNIYILKTFKDLEKQGLVKSAR